MKRFSSVLCLVAAVGFAAEGGTVKVWNGGNAGDWHGAASWAETDGSASTPPGEGDDAAVQGTAAISLEGTGYAKSLTVTGEGTDAAVGGGADARLRVGGRIEVGAGARLEVSTKVQNNGDALVKEGKGELKLSGDNAGNLDGDIEAREGVTEFASAAALGNPSSAGYLKVGNSTFRYTGAERAETMRKLRLGSALPAILDIQGDMWFKDFGVEVDAADAGIVKIGGGTLRLDMPEGKTVLSVHEKATRGPNAYVKDNISPVNGELPDWKGAAQFTVLDGRVEIRGKGRDKTRVLQPHHTGIGGSGVASPGGAELYLKDLRFDQGTLPGFHIYLDNFSFNSRSKGARLVLDNAEFYCNTIKLGGLVNGSIPAGTKYTPTIAITNSTLEISYAAEFPVYGNNYVKFAAIVAENGVFRHSGLTQRGIYFKTEVDVRVESGGVLEAKRHAAIMLTDSAWGKMRFSGGGKLDASLLISESTTRRTDFEFDGGVAVFSGDGKLSATYNAGASGFVVGEGGMELAVEAGVRHLMAIPMRGEGMVRKTGEGTLALTNAMKSATAAADEAVAMVQNGGGMTVEAGEVVLASPGVTDRGSRFALREGTALDLGGGDWETDGVVGGPGVMKNGVFCGALKAATGVGEGPVQVDGTVEFAGGAVDVDFGLAADYAATTPMAGIGVAVLGEGVEFWGVEWRAVNIGSSNTCRFTYNASTRTVKATVMRSGMTIIVR